MERIIGIGVDQIEVSRIVKACEKESFLQKIYSDEEHGLIAKRKSCAATNFAGKEAVAKAIGSGFAGISPKEISILRKESGAPFVRLSGRARELAKEQGITAVHISLSDSKTFAIAYAVAVGEALNYSNR